jgi:short subunit dehydrogenase-like uncharacterized protein
LYLHRDQAVRTLTLALHPTLSLSLRMQEYQALVDILSAFILRFTRKSTLSRILSLPGLAPSTLSRASHPIWPRVVFSTTFGQSKLVYIKQEPRTVDELSALVVVRIGVANDEVIHLCSVIFLRMARTR